MNKPLIILADQDEKYIEILEQKFLEEIYQYVDLEIITDVGYFNQYFSTPRTAEILVISQGLYSSDLQKHNIAHVFVLMEDDNLSQTGDIFATPVYKYSVVKDLFNELTYQSRDRIYENGNDKQETKVIGFYSAIGGSGKTSLSLGFASALAQNHQRVLYLSTESVQSFHYYLDSKDGMPGDAYRGMRENDANIYRTLQPFLRYQGFSYVPPFLATLDALNLRGLIFENFVKNAKLSHDYDFIVMDLQAGYSGVSTNLLQLADKVLMVMTQTDISVFKTQWILKNIDFYDSEKCIFVCNQFDNTRTDDYMNSEISKRFPLQEKVPFIPGDLRRLEDLSKINEVQKLAYMFV